MIATHVSRPIRSASASGPIGCAKPSFAHVSIARLRHALHQRVRGLVDERHQDAVRDEAGEVVRLGRGLAQVAGEGDDRLGRLVGRLLGTDHLDEGEHRHGIEEVHADHALRARSRPRSSVMGIEDVFEASTASAGRASSAERKSAFFASGSRRSPRSSGRRL